MFGGVLTLVFAAVLRLLQVRQWREGVGLSPQRRFLLPAVAVVIGLIGLRRVHGGDASTHAGLLIAAFAITLIGGAVRALSATRSSTTPGAMYPGGVLFRARPVATLLDVLVPLAAAALVLPALVPDSGLHAGAAVWTLALGVGDLLASLLLLSVRRTGSAVAR